MKLHKIPEIDCAQRDPVIESYQNLGSKSHNKSAVVEDNEKVKTNETNEISQKQDDPDEMQVDDVDDDSDSDTKELPQYKTEQLVKINSVEIEQQRITLMEHFRNLDKPNFKILEEFKKRVR